jgi:hypothetical protein
VTGNEPQPGRPDRPTDEPPDPGQPGYEPYTPPWAEQPNHEPRTHQAGQPSGYDQYGQPTGYQSGQPSGYDQYGQPTYSAYPPYPAYPTYPGYQGYTVYPYPPPPYQVVSGDGVRSQAIASLICNIIASLFCCLVFGVPGIVLSAIAMGRSERDPTSAHKLVKWSWGALAAAVVAGITVFVLLIVFAPAES